MANKKKENKEVNEQAQELDLTAVNFDELSDEDKKRAFEQLKEQNKGLTLLIKDLAEQAQGLEEKAQGKVSDDTYMRLVADFDNFKRRNATAVSAAYEDGKIEVIKGLLDVVDNLERAIATMADENDKKGAELIYKQASELLKKLGVVEIEALNKPFDPNLHNAVMQAEAENADEVDTCVEVFQKGYSLNNKVIRYSFVKVAK